MRERTDDLRWTESETALMGKLAAGENLALALVTAVVGFNIAGGFAPVAATAFKGGWAPMSAPAAVAALLSAASLYFSGPRFGRRARRMGMGIAFLVAAGSAAVFAKQLAISTLGLSSEAAWPAMKMPLQGAGGFALLAIAILLSRARRPLAAIFADFFTFCLLFVTAVLVSGYIIGSLRFFGPVSAVAISAQSLFCLSLLSLAVFLRRAHNGVFSILLGDGIGSKVVRIVTPILVMLPYIREGLRAHLLGLGRMPPHYITALLATVAAAVSMSLLIYLAWRLNALESEIKGMSLRDPLTGLNNLRGFQLLAKQALLLARRSHEPFSVLFVDVDDLKQINDELGHQAGSGYLAATATILRDTFRETDVLGRIGGDEFAVAGQFGRAGIADAARRLQNGAAQYKMHHTRFALSLSIGSATAETTNRTTLPELLACADEEMYREKRRRKAAAERSYAVAPVQTDLEPVHADKEAEHT